MARKENMLDLFTQPDRFVYIIPVCRFLLKSCKSVQKTGGGVEQGNHNRKYTVGNTMGLFRLEAYSRVQKKLNRKSTVN